MVDVGVGVALNVYFRLFWLFLISMKAKKRRFFQFIFFLFLLNWTLASFVVFVVKNQIRADNPWFFLPFKPRVKFSRNWNHCNSKLYDNSYLLIKTLYQHLRASWKEQPAKCLKTFVLSFDRLIKSDFLYREMQLSLCIQSTESGHVRHHQLLLPLVLV